MQPFALSPYKNDNWKFVNKKVVSRKTQLDPILLAFWETRLARTRPRTHTADVRKPRNQGGSDEESAEKRQFFLMVQENIRAHQDQHEHPQPIESCRAR